LKAVQELEAELEYTHIHFHEQNATVGSVIPVEPLEAIREEAFQAIFRLLEERLYLSVDKTTTKTKTTT
jgi:hypothetical protein